MASGQVNRIKRPNTWLQRPMLQNREESSCQTGAVHTWHFSDMPRQSDDVRFWAYDRHRKSHHHDRRRLDSGQHHDAVWRCRELADTPRGCVSAPDRPSA